MGAQQLLFTAGLAAAATAAAAAVLVSPQYFDIMSSYSFCTDDHGFQKEDDDGDVQQQDCDEEGAAQWAQTFLLSLSAKETAAQIVLNKQWMRCMQSMLPLAAAAAVGDQYLVSEGHSKTTAQDELQSYPAAGGSNSRSCNSHGFIWSSLGGCLSPAAQNTISPPHQQQGSEAVQVMCNSVVPQAMVPEILTLSDSPASLHSQEMPVRSAASFFLGSQLQHPSQGPKQECQVTMLDSSEVGSSTLPSAKQPSVHKGLRQHSYTNSKATKLWRFTSSAHGNLLEESNSSTGPCRCENNVLLQLCSSSSIDAAAGANSTCNTNAETQCSQIALPSNCLPDTMARAHQSRRSHSTQQHQHQLYQKLEQCSQQQQTKLTMTHHQCSVQQLAHISGQLAHVEELSDVLLQHCSNLVAEKEGLGAALQLARAHAQQVEVRHDVCLSKLMHTQQQLEQQRMQHKAASCFDMQRLQRLCQQVQAQWQQAARHKIPSNNSSCTSAADVDQESCCTQAAEPQTIELNAWQQLAQQPEAEDAMPQPSIHEQGIVAQLESSIQQLLDQQNQALAPMSMLQQQVQHLSAELQRATQIAETAVFDKQELQRAKSVLQRKLSELQLQLVKQHQALTKVTNDRMAIAAAKTNLHHQLQGLQDINKQLQDAARLAQDASTAQEQKMQQLQQEVDALQAELAAAVAKQQQAEQALKLSHSECDNGLYQVAQLHLKLQEAKMEHRREVEQMQEQLDALTAENLLQTQKLQQAPPQEQWQHLKDQLDSALVAKEHAAQQASTAEVHAELLQQELTALQAAYERSSHEAGQLQQVLTAVKTAQESSSQVTTAQQKQLQQELAAALAARDSVTEDVVQLKQHHDECTADLTQMHMQLSSAMAAYEESTQSACQLLQQLQQSAALVEKLQQFTRCVPQLQEELAATASAYSSSAAEATLLNKQLAESAAALRHLQQEMAAVAAERDRNATAADKVKEQLQTSVTDIQRLHRELTVAQAENERVAAEAAKSATLIEKLQQELKAVTAAHEGLELEVGQLKQQVQQLQQSATGARQLQQELLTAWQAHESDAATISQLQQELEQSAADKQQVQEELSAAKAAAGRVAHEADELQQQLQQATASMQQLRQELAAASAAVDAATQQTAVVQLQQQLDEAAFEVKQLQLELSAAKRARDGALTEVSQLQQQLQSATANVKQLKKQLAAVNSGKALLDQVSRLQLQVTKLTQEHAEAEACSRGLQEQLQQAQSELKALQDERDLENSQLIEALGAAHTRIAGSTQQVAEAQHDVTQLAHVVELQQQQLAWQQETIRRLKSALPQSQLQGLMPDGDDTPWSSTCTSPRGTISPGANNSRVPSPFRQPSRPATPYLQQLQQQQPELMPTLTVVSATRELPATAHSASSHDLCSQQEPRGAPRAKHVKHVPCSGPSSSATADSSSSSSNSCAVRHVANRCASAVGTAGSDACRLPTGQPQHAHGGPCANNALALSLTEGSHEAAGTSTTPAAAEQLDKPTGTSSKALTHSKSTSSKGNRNRRRISAASSSGGGVIVLPQQTTQATQPRRTSTSSSRKQGAAIASPAPTSSAATGSLLLKDSLVDSCDTKVQLSGTPSAPATSNSLPNSAGAAAADVSSSGSAISLEGAVVMDHKSGWLWAAGAGSRSDLPRGGLEVLSAEFDKLHDFSGMAGIGSLSVGGWGQPGSEGSTY